MITAADIQAIRDADPSAILPGIDTMTGNPYATSSLLEVTKISHSNNAPYYYSPSANTVYVTQAGAVLKGINFGSATVQIQANNVTIQDCTFTGTSSWWAIADQANNATVENCTFIGSKSPTEQNVWIASSQYMTVANNTFLNSPADAVVIQQGVVTGNYFSGEGYATGAHADAIYVPDTTGPISITDNFIEETANNGTTGIPNTTIRITDEFGNTNGVTVSSNYLLGAGINFEVSASSANYTVSNVSITNNDVGFAWYAQYYAGTDTLATVAGNQTVDFTNPTASAIALAAYIAAGIPTPIVISGTAGGLAKAVRYLQRSWGTAMRRPN